MAAYLIANIDVQDPEGYAGYIQLFRPIFEKYNGRIIVSNSQVEVKEGAWSPKRLVILEFASIEIARQFYDSPQYQEAKAIREKYSRADFLLVEGM